MIDLKNLDQIASGPTLTLEERALLGPAMRALQVNEKFLSCKLWGKILATNADYIVVCGIGHSDDVNNMPNKSFYYCTSDNIDLKPLNKVRAHPEVSPRTEFTGEPSQVLATEFVEEKDSEDEPRDYTEVDHLSCVVRSIDENTSTCPRGAYVANASKNLVPSISFNGLSQTEAQQLDSYCHFRKPANILAAYDKDGMVKPTGLLDSITTSHPKGGWSLQSDPANTVVTLRSLLYPGYTFYHEIGTQNFGDVYVGDGIKNSDIAFML